MPIIAYINNNKTNQLFNYVEFSDKLITLQKTMTDIEKVHEPHNDKAKKHITNQLFVGSTAELAALIANNKPALPS